MEKEKKKHKVSKATRRRQLMVWIMLLIMVFGTIAGFVAYFIAA